MRQIASDAGCSHTAIYRYFPDKEALLEAIAVPVLAGLTADFDRIVAADLSWEARLLDMCLRFVRFGITSRSMFRLFATVHAGRVDREPGGSEINFLRIGLFRRLRETLAGAVGLEMDDDRTLDYARGLYYLLHGMIGTYEESAESDEELLSRLESTFITAIRSLVGGFRTAAKTTINDGVGEKPPAQGGA